MTASIKILLERIYIVDTFFPWINTSSGLLFLLPCDPEMIAGYERTPNRFTGVNSTGTTALCGLHADVL
jgi:hypothetical protein